MTPTRPPTQKPLPRSRRHVAAAWSAHLVLAAVAYIPLLRSAPGMVEDDSKQYLYIDPARFMSQVVSMWNPDVSMGTVSHQYIGYLLPMGPYYALMNVLGVPTWVAQRLWTGSLLFLAGAGVLFLLRTLSPGTGRAGTGSLDTATIGGVGAMVAALAYMLSPYVLQNEARQSALLLPWVGLPWMIGLTARALRRGGWRHSALFALVVALVGSTNAVALILVGVGPALWIVWELVSGRVRWSRALSTALKIGLLSAAVSLWWASGLAVEGAYGMDILKFTESIPTVARTSLASETLRGLGYWFFYGVDKMGLYLPMAGPYMTSLWLVEVSFAVPATAFLAAFVLRWRQRAYFVALVVVGTVLSVGAHPLSNPSPLGTLVKKAATGSTVGLALRSTNRATPLVVLGTAVLLGAGVAALLRRWKFVGMIVAAAATALVAADLPALWTGQFVAANLSRPEHIPSYWGKAARFLDTQAGAASTRVALEPGIDFSTYRWGTTLEPVLPGLITRPEVDRGIVPYGSPGSANLLDTFDDDIQNQTFNPSAVAPLLRIMSAGDLVVQSDLAYEHYNTPRPRALWQKLDPAPAGLGNPVGFGNPSVTAAPSVKYPLIDETELGLPHNAPYPPPVTVFPVPGARPILRAEGATTPILLDGDGAGLIAAAGAGLLDGHATVFYSPSYTSKPTALQGELAKGADLVVTDTNRKQAQQFGTVGDNFGYTETVGEKPLVPDTRDARLPLFDASTGDTNETVAEQLGVKSIQASNYGNPITYVPEDRPDQAMDGNLRTTWTVASFDNPVGEYLRIVLAHPLTTDQVNLVQPLYGPRNRWITRATLRFDGGHAMTVKLGSSSRTSAGQTIRFPTRSFTTLKITIDATNTGIEKTYNGKSGVGFAEVRLPAEQVDEVLRMPEDLLDAAGAASASHRLTIDMTRETAAAVPPATDPEIDIARTFTLPTSRDFSVSGTAALSTYVPDDVLDHLLGTTVPGIVAAYSSGRLPGAIGDRTSATLDGNLNTVWSPGIGPQAGSWLRYALVRPITFDHLSMAIVTDGRHSVPTSITVSAGGQSRTVALPALVDRTQSWATQDVSVAFPALTGANVKVTFDAVRSVTDLDYYSDVRVALPIGIAEMDIPGMPRAVPGPTQLPATCRSDLFTVDGAPVPVTVTGTTAAAASLGTLQVRGCGSAANGIALGAGVHVVRTQPGIPPGVDVDINSVVLDSAPGGAAMPTAASGRVEPVESGPAPTVRVVSSSATSAKVDVHDPTGPFWMVLGQSTNVGWHATTSTGLDLGAPQVIDGYANGWLVTPSKPGRDMVITLDWTPQRLVWIALVVSAATLGLCLVLACWPRRRRQRHKGATVTVPAIPTSEDVDSAAITVDSVVSPSSPLLGSPLRSYGTRPRWFVALAVAVVIGAVTSAIISPRAGLPVGLAAFLALVVGYGRVFLAIGSVGLLVAVDRMVTSGQSKFRFLAEFGWPTHFETASTLAWFAVAALGADALVQEVRDRRARRTLVRGDGLPDDGLPDDGLPDDGDDDDAVPPGASSAVDAEEGDAVVGDEGNTPGASDPQRRPHATVARLMVDVAPVPVPEAVDEVSENVDDDRTGRRWGRRRRVPAHGAASARPRHFPCFDGLRAIAAVLVVLVHTSFASGLTLRSSAGIYTARLEIGVAVFFLISGFLLYRPFAASHIAGGAAPATGKFWVRRFLRIMPAYWLAFVVTNYVMHIDTKVHPGWHSLLIYLGLVQVYVPSHALTGITQAWSLCTEIVFYLFLPLYAMLVVRGRRSDRHQLRRELVALAGLFGVGLGLRFWLLHLHSPMAYIALEWLPSCFDLFALGMFLAVVSSWLAHRRSTPRWLWNPALPWVSWALALGMLWAVSHLGVSRSPLEHNPPGRGVAQEVLYGLFAFFLLLPAVFGPQRTGTIRWFLRWKPVAALGVVSYGVYLWHQAWVDLYVFRWTHALFRVPLPELFGAAFGLAVASATLSYVLVERPILGLKDRLGWWSGSRRPGPEPATSVATAAPSTD